MYFLQQPLGRPCPRPPGRQVQPPAHSKLVRQVPGSLGAARLLTTATRCPQRTSPLVRPLSAPQVLGTGDLVCP